MPGGYVPWLDPPLCTNYGILCFPKINTLLHANTVTPLVRNDNLLQHEQRDKQAAKIQRRILVKPNLHDSSDGARENL